MAARCVVDSDRRRQQVEATTTVNNDRRRQQHVEATATVNNDRPVPSHSARRSSTRESYIDSDQKCPETICRYTARTVRRTTTTCNSRAFPGGSNADKTDIRRSPSVDILEITFLVSPSATYAFASARQVNNDKRLQQVEATTTVTPHSYALTFFLQ